MLTRGELGLYLVKRRLVWLAPDTISMVTCNSQNTHTTGLLASVSTLILIVLMMVRVPVSIGYYSYSSSKMKSNYKTRIVLASLAVSCATSRRYRSDSKMQGCCVSRASNLDESPSLECSLHRGKQKAMLEHGKISRCSTKNNGIAIRETRLMLPFSNDQSR